MFLERKESTQFQLEENRETAGASMGVQVFQQEKNITFFSLFIRVKNMTKKIVSLKKVQIPENLTEH